MRISTRNHSVGRIFCRLYSSFLAGINAQKLWVSSSRYVFVLVLLILFSSAQAETYYISNSGKDSNPGTSESLPWRSLEKVNVFSFNPGDEILFKRGDQWKSGILLNASGSTDNPILYGAYGQGEKPVFHGDRKIIGWSHHQGNIYKATVSNPVNQLSFKGETMQVARYPDSTYLFMSSIASNTTFLCDELSGTDWEGATAILRLVPWSFEAWEITGSSGNSITIGHVPLYAYAMNSGDPFFVINSLTTLDGPGQWVYQESTNTLYFWPPDNSMPDDESVRASVDEYGFFGSDISHVNIQDICIKGFGRDGILLSGLCSNLSIQNCELINNYECGVNCNDDPLNHQITISNNLISGSNRGGIRLKGSHCNINNNTLEDISLMANIGMNAFVDSYNTACGIHAYPVHESVISNNKLKNIGYIGIMFYGNNNILEFNRIEEACLTLQDGGGIYSHGDANGSVIRNNIISTIGPATDHQCFGIYMDATSEGMHIENNTVFDCNGSGIFISNCKNIWVTENILFDNKDNEMLSSNHVDEILMFGNVISDNVFFVKKANELQKSMKLTGNNVYGQGVTCSNNVHGCPETNSIYYVFAPFYWTYMTLQEFQEASGNGEGSTRAMVSDYTNAELFYNDTNTEKTYYFNQDTFRDLNGDIVTTLTLQAFTSQILVKD